MRLECLRLVRARVPLHHVDGHSERDTGGGWIVCILGKIMSGSEQFFQVVFKKSKSFEDKRYDFGS